MYTDPKEKCVACAKKGFACEAKWRRGGPQGSVKLSVLEAHSHSNPEWTLKDAIAYLKENGDTVLIRERSTSLEGSEVSLPIAPPDYQTQLESMVKHETDPLTMELSFPGMALN